MQLEIALSVLQILTLADVEYVHSQVHQLLTPSTATNVKAVLTSSTTQLVRKHPVVATLSSTLTVQVKVKHVRHVIVLSLTVIHVQIKIHVLSVRHLTSLIKMVNVKKNHADYMIQQQINV